MPYATGVDPQRGVPAIMATVTTKKKNTTGLLGNKVCGACGMLEGSDNLSKLLACARCGLVVYCSKGCQRAHWKANHKQRCITKADRARQQQKPSEAHRDASAAASAMETCVICLELVLEEFSCTLPCGHVFHGTCVSELRKFGVEQACPLCRTPLPLGPEKIFEEATWHYVAACQMIKRSRASWSTFPAFVQRELDAAIAGWRAAAEDGHAAAQFNLGRIYEEGCGVARSVVKAVRLYRMAADQGLAEAQYNFGVMYANGCGVTQSDVKAALLYRKAAEQGHAKAQYNLGNKYSRGLGVAQSDVEAARWLKMAADQGLASAQHNLGIKFSRGLGVAQSDVEAARWFKMAAHQGFAEAQFNVGVKFALGQGVAKSYVEANRWSKMAADQGHTNAKSNLELLALIA